MEFSVDPLFKKVSADFDEGGAKGLLLNHLAIDNKGRIVFDSSEDIQEEPEDDEDKTKEGEANKSEDIDLQQLRLQFFPDLDKIDELDVCPSLKNFDLGDPTGSLDIPFLKALDDKQGNGGTSDNGGDGHSPRPFEEGAFEPGPFDGGAFEIGGFDDDDDDDLYALPGQEQMEFGDGGVVWANETLADAQEQFMTPGRARAMSVGVVEVEGTPGIFNRSIGAMPHPDDVLSYFDEALRKNWAGPEHWKIRKIKGNNNPHVLVY